MLCHGGALDVRNVTTTSGRLFGGVFVALSAFGLVGCKADECDPGLVDRAVSFLNAHQSCTVNDDCVVVGDFCETLPGGYCGQLVMNRQGRDSAEWADLTKALKDCSPSECTVCGAAVIPGCTSGSCGGP
jgi:hypothetical protein